MKRTISKEDIEFLKGLQANMDNVKHEHSTNPKFWVVAGSRKIYGSDEGDTQNFELYDCVNEIAVADGFEESFNYIKKEILPVINSNANSGIHCKLELNSGHKILCMISLNDIKKHTYEYTIKELIEWINKSDKFQFEILNYEYITHVLTKQVNWNIEHQRYNPTESPSYAMTALSCSQLEQLGKLLQEVDFDKLESLLVKY